MIGKHKPLYRLEHLVLQEDVLRLQELCAKYEVSFPTLAAEAFDRGLEVLEEQGPKGECRALGQFQRWVKATLAHPRPSSSKMMILLQEMFLLWNPLRQKDFEDGLKKIEGPMERHIRRRTLDWWLDYCNQHSISPTLLVDDSARW